MHGVRAAARALAALSLVVAAMPPATAADPSDAAVQARVYEIRHRSVADAADLAGALLSAEGSLTLQPRLRTLLVQDHPEVLDRIASVLEAFDRPPRNVEVTASLFLGTERRERPAAEGGEGRTSRDVSREVRGVMETLADFTKWNEYVPLGSFAVTGVEGSPVTAYFSEDYRVVFEVESVGDAAGEIVFRRFSLQRVVVTAEGGERAEEIYGAGVVLRAGVMSVVGAAKGPDSKRALFLALRAKPR